MRTCPLRRDNSSFDLARYVDEGGLNFRLGNEPLALELLLEEQTAFHLRETPLSQDQMTQDERDGRVRLTATVSDTAQVRWWLLGLGANVEVVNPPHLRDEIAQALRQAASRYG
ncbi:helix-turn-helix transcriptional regulator [Aquisalimonas sp. APHAB1-3]|uniref:helix-turn-helix transcriptional regulator n=1 Tax=Aquisalimonas sp. APHAB1-3 TaxID=3402080 RepID=UPI003AB07480